MPIYTIGDRLLVASDTMAAIRSRLARSACVGTEMRYGNGDGDVIARKVRVSDGWLELLVWQPTAEWPDKIEPESIFELGFELVGKDRRYDSLPRSGVMSVADDERETLPELAAVVGDY